jgi:hypothetical protein
MVTASGDGQKASAKRSGNPSATNGHPDVRTEVIDIHWYFSYFANLYAKWKITRKGSIHEQREDNLPRIGEVIAPRV